MIYKLFKYIKKGLYKNISYINKNKQRIENFRGKAQKKLKFKQVN